MRKKTKKKIFNRYKLEAKEIETRVRRNVEKVVRKIREDSKRGDGTKKKAVRVLGWKESGVRSQESGVRSEE